MEEKFKELYNKLILECEKDLKTAREQVRTSLYYKSLKCFFIAYISFIITSPSDNVLYLILLLLQYSTTLSIISDSGWSDL